MAKKSSDDTGLLLDWRQAPDVLALTQRERDLRQELGTREWEVHQKRAAIEEGPAKLRELFRLVMLKRAPDSDVGVLKVTLATEEDTLGRLEAQVSILREELDALPDALREVEESAQHAVAARLQADHREDAQALLDAYGVAADITARMAQRYRLAGQQFPMLAYALPKPKGYARDIKAHAGLTQVYDAEAVRAQRGMALWEPLTFGGRFKQLYDGLRAYLGLPLDRGEIPPAGQIALAEHKRAAAEARNRPERIAHEKAAAAYNKARQQEKDAEILAHRLATEQALQDAQRH